MTAADERPAEETRVHTRLMKCALEVDDCRSYWQHTDGTQSVDAQTAFEGYVFGARSLPRVKVLLANMRARFDAFPPSLPALHLWRPDGLETRRLICHWHLQLADPLYRDFTGTYLEGRRQGARADVTRDLVTRWVGDQGPTRWTMASRVQIASKLLSSAHAAGLVAKTRDPRPLSYPRVTDEALEYVLHLLRGVKTETALLQSPYLASVGLAGSTLEDRLRQLPSLRFRRQPGLVDFGWQHADLLAWAQAQAPTPLAAGAGQ